MAEKVDQDVRDGAIWLAKECNPDEAEWIVPYYEQGGSSPLTEILARMKAAGRQQGLREAAEVVMAKAEGVRKKASRDREITDSRCGLVLGYEDAEAAITALMEGEGK